MKLSEAIRIGATMYPRCEGSLTKWNADGELCTCALGAAFTALYPDHDPTDASYSAITDQVEGFEGDGWPTVEMPNGDHLDLIEAAWTLNDVEHWEREAVADYLATKGH